MRCIGEKIIGTVDASKMIINRYSKNRDEIISIENIGEVNIKKGDTMGMALGDIKRISSIEVLGLTNSDDYIIEASLDNKRWKQVFKDTSIYFFVEVLAKYIRIRYIKDTKVDLYEIEIYLVGNTTLHKDEEKTCDENVLIKDYSNTKMKLIEKKYYSLSRKIDKNILEINV